MMHLLTLPPLSEVEKVPPHETPAEIARLAALQSALAARLVAGAPSPAPQSVTKLYTAREVAAIFSLRLDRVYELARTRRIPSIAVGKRAMRFDIEAVRKALAS